MAEQDSANDRTDTEAAPSDAPQGVTDRDFGAGTQDAITSGAKVRSTIKFGDGPREQVAMKIEGRGANAEEAATDFMAAVQRVKEADAPEDLAELQKNGDVALASLDE